MKKENIKYIIVCLIVIAFLIEILAIFGGYRYLIMQTSNMNISTSSELFLTMLLSLSYMGIIYLIAYIVSIYKIMKNKYNGYLISGIVSSFIFYHSVDTIIKYNVTLNLTMVITAIFWIALIILSFVFYFKLKKEIIHK